MFVKLEGTRVRAVAYSNVCPSGWVEVPDFPVEEMGCLEDWSYENGQLARSSLNGLRARLRDQINHAVGQARLRYVTDIPGQQMIYLEKRAEALRYLALEPEPASLDGFPFLAAEAGITAPTARSLAELWVAQSSALTAAAATLENLRLGALSAVESAPTAEQATAAFEAFSAALASV